MYWLSALLALSLVVPIAVSLARRRNACFWTVIWNFLIFVVMTVADLIVDNGLYGQVVVDLGFDTAMVGDPAEAYRLVTAMYVHAGPLHVLMNMVILTLIGVPFEDRIGTGRWLAIYLVSGVIGSLVDAGFAYAAGTSHIGIGASGAIFGVMGAFAVLYPRDEIPMVLGFVFLQRVPVFAAVIVMAILETVYLFGTAPADNIGHLVHVASLVAGVALALPLARVGRKKAGAAEGAPVDPEALRKLVTTEELRSLYDKITKEDLPEVREAWMGEFAKKARCPDCGKPLSHSPGRLACRSCGFKLIYGK